MIMLYDFLKLTECDYDTCDDVYDETVTVCINTEPEDDFDEFCVELCKKIEIKKIDDSYLVCNWSDFIKNNMPVLREYANKYWYKNNYDDEDDFICEWIKEFHLLLAGYGTDYDIYKEEIIDKCNVVKY